MPVEQIFIPELKNTTVDILLNRLEINYEIIKNWTIRVKWIDFLLPEMKG